MATADATKDFVSRQDLTRRLRPRRWCTSFSFVSGVVS
jgi:hypothetical protein